jgi:hypothetical protein
VFSSCLARLATVAFGGAPDHRRAKLIIDGGDRVAREVRIVLRRRRPVCSTETPPGGGVAVRGAARRWPRMSRGLLDAITEALRGAGVGPEAINAAVAAYEAWERAHVSGAARGGVPRPPVAILTAIVPSSFQRATSHQQRNVLMAAT